METNMEKSETVIEDRDKRDDRKLQLWKETRSVSPFNPCNAEVSHSPLISIRF